MHACAHACMHACMHAQVVTWYVGNANVLDKAQRHGIPRRPATGTLVVSPHIEPLSIPNSRVPLSRILAAAHMCIYDICIYVMIYLYRPRCFCCGLVRVLPSSLGHGRSVYMVVANNGLGVSKTSGAPNMDPK